MHRRQRKHPPRSPNVWLREEGWQLLRQAKLNAGSRRSKSPNTAQLPKKPRRLLSSAILRKGLSARAYHRVLKVARTCADLSGAPDIRTIDVAEAVNCGCWIGPADLFGERITNSGKSLFRQDHLFSEIM